MVKIGHLYWTVYDERIMKGRRNNIYLHTYYLEGKL
jgi:hypothetical protein